MLVPEFELPSMLLAGFWCVDYVAAPSLRTEETASMIVSQLLMLPCADDLTLLQILQRTYLAQEHLDVVVFGNRDRGKLFRLVFKRAVEKIEKQFIIAKETPVKKQP